MSKSKRRRSSGKTATRPPAPPPKKRLPPWLLWAGVAAVGVLATLALLVWQGNRDAGAGTSDAQGTPNLVVDQTSIDFGDVPVNKMVKASFKLSNTGDGPLTISHPPVPEVLEGC